MNAPTVEALQAAIGDTTREDGWRDECGACQDTGWELHECHGGERGFCGRRQNHAAHSYVEVCTCRPTNRTYQRHQETRGRVSR